MNRHTWRATFALILIFSTSQSRVALMSGQTTGSQAGKPGPNAVNASHLLKKLNELVEQNNKLEKQNRELMDQIEALRQFLGHQTRAAAAGIVQQNGEPTTDAVTLSPTKPAEAATTPNPAASIFGFYTRGLKGVTFTIGATTLF